MVVNGIMFANIKGFLSLNKRETLPHKEKQLIAAEIVGSLGFTTVRDKLIVAWAINSLLWTPAKLTYNTAMTLLDLPAEPKIIWRTTQFLPFSYTSLESRPDVISRHILLSITTKSDHDITVDLHIVCGVVELNQRTQKLLQERKAFDLKQVPLLADMEAASLREGPKAVISK